MLDTLTEGTAWATVEAGGGGDAPATGPANIDTDEILQTSARGFWDFLSKAERYDLRYGTATGVYGTTVSDIEALEYNFSGLTANQEYFYQVRGDNQAGGAGPWSSEETFTTLPNSPVSANKVKLFNAMVFDDTISDEAVAYLYKDIVNNEGKSTLPLF